MAIGVGLGNTSASPKPADAMPPDTSAPAAILFKLVRQLHNGRFTTDPNYDDASYKVDRHARPEGETFDERKAVSLVMARPWSIRVDLVSGRGEDYWPRPGRVFAASQTHRFSQLAEAIDTAFARWDRAHLYKFELADGRVIGQPEFDDFDQGFLDGEATKLSTLSLGDQFVYEFDFGDGWTHLCEVAPERIDPESELGIVPRSPLPYQGWGSIPDQYGCRWIDDDGESTEPPDPGLIDLPPLQPGWGPQPRR